MKTPASQWTVLVSVLAGITVALWVAGRAVQSPRPDPTPLDLFASPASAATTAEPVQLALVPPEVDVPRVRIERPLDETRCATHAEESTLTAVIEDQNGRRISGARLVAFGVEGSAPVFRAFVEARSLDDGRACLRTAHGGTLLVAVFAPGALPSARFVESTSGTRLDLEPFVIESGASIHGTVRIGGQPIARAEIEVVHETDAEVFEVGDRTYAWRNERFVPVKATAETDASGKYSVSGLAAGNQSVRLRAIRQPNVAIDVSKSAQQRVTAPAGEVDFVLPGARLRLDFRSTSGPLCCVDAQIEAGDRQFTRSSDESGRLEVIIQPSLAYPIIATRRGFTTKRFQMRGLIDGERVAQTVELEPQISLATVRIDDDRSSSVDEVKFMFRPRAPLMHGSSFERTIRRDPRAGDFVIPNVPAGAWVVTLVSGRVISAPSTMEGRGHLALHANCDVDIPLVVPDTGVLTAKAVVIRRGGAEVIVRDESGARIQAQAKLFDTRGEEVDAVAIKGENQAPFASTTPPHSYDSLFVYPLTCFGTFQLAVHQEGYEPARISLTTQPGQVVPLEVVLKPK